MNDIAIGRAFRSLRQRLGYRQSDVGMAAGVSQQLISKVERGRIGRLSHATLARIFAAVDADVVTIIRWRGGELDRLLDEGHAALVGRICDLLRARGWEVFPEVSFSEYGERGSIDVLAWHAASRTLLVIEVKTEITSAEETLRRHDVKVRLAPRIAQERFGVRAALVARLLVVGDSSTNRRRVTRLGAVLAATYPARGQAVRTWLRRPDGRLDGLLFATPAAGGPAGHPVRRVRRPRVTQHPSGAPTPGT
jgi:transcriptional regulator with XRE-family HTH domain